MRFHATIAQRVAWALTGLVMLAIGLMAAVVFVVHIKMEDRLIDGLLASEARHLLAEIGREHDEWNNPLAREISPVMRAWGEHPARPAPGMPASLRSLGDGIHRVRNGSQTWHVAVSNALDGKLYVVYDAANHEKLARDFGLFLAVTAVLFMLLAYVLGRRVAHRVVSPLQILTDRLTQWAPGTPNFPVSRSDEAGRLMEAFNRVQDELDDSIAREREFAANLHHEVRTPLSRIRSDSELMLRRPALDDADSRRLRRIMRSVDDITESLETTYDIAHAEKGLQEPVSLFECVEDTFSRLEQEAKSTGLVMENRTDPAETGLLNRYALLTVMRNLARNAAQHAAPGTLVVKTIRNGLAFMDSGPGIAADELPFIFDRFYSTPPVDEGTQAPEHRPQDRRGKAGLGLAIARRICLTHGWSITVRSPAASDSDGGAAFLLTFPGQNIIPNTLATAFQNAHYVAFAPEKTLVLRIGQHAPALARLFLQYSVPSLAILTAYNPRAQTASNEANRVAQDQLRHAVDKLGLASLAGENRAKEDDGPCEPTIIILGISRERSRQLAQEFGQLAFVYVDASCLPELIWICPD